MAQWSWVLLISSLLIGCGSPLAASALVAVPAVYDITLSGTTYLGDTTFPSAGTIWSPQTRVGLPGTLVLLPTQDASGATFDNGINPIDVGLFAGNPPASPQPGAIWFATNTSVFREVGIGNVSQGLAAIDTAFVDFDTTSRTLSVVADGNFAGLPAARTGQLNVFTMYGGVAAFPYQILLGSMSVQLQDAGQTIVGALDFAGTGYLNSNSARLIVTFSGVRR